MKLAQPQIPPEKESFPRGRGCLPIKALATEGLPYWGFCSKTIMINKNDILKREKKTLKGFFNTELIDIPDIPNWVTNHLLEYWDKNLFYVHYIPKITLSENLNLPSWKDKPSKMFYRKISEGKLKKEAQNLTGKWVLIDGRDKPQKKVLWVRINDVWVFEKMGFKPKNYFKKWNKQLHQNEYLTGALKEKGFGSRFCLTIKEINNLKPYILKFLKIDSNKIIRLPFFMEYNYLGNAIYNQWKVTETWEWLEDTLSDGQHLASGCGSVGVMGWDPPEFWSTILTFRPVIEL